jgi:hypothetical protein
MAKSSGGSSSGRSSGGTHSTGGRSYPNTGASPARQSQPSGPANAFGGYTKVANPDGSYRMRPTGK